MRGGQVSCVLRVLAGAARVVLPAADAATVRCDFGRKSSRVVAPLRFCCWCPSWCR